LLRIVPALDGGICRIKLPCGQLTAAQADAIATASARYASGVIEITNRANLQIRGIEMPHADALIAELLAAGLGAATPGGDDVRNVMVSPSAGIDAAALCDTTPLAMQILSLLQTQTRLHQLSPKFSISLDGGEALAMLEHPHDLWLSAISTSGHQHAGKTQQAARFVFGLAGCPAQSNALAVVAAEHVVTLVDAVLNTFLDLASAEQARMRQLLQSISAQEFLRRLKMRFPFALSTDVSAWCRQPALPHAHIGIHTQCNPSNVYVGAVPALGRIDTAQLRALAQLATRFGDGTFRLTPWQSVLLPSITHASAEIVLRKLKQRKFTTTAVEPLAHLIACTGARACAKGLADTKADALQLAQLLQNAPRKNSLPPAVHLSGCSRSCAAAFVAPFTLLAVAEGRYDLFRREKNTADFGALIAADIDIAHALKLFENEIHLEKSND
jgi:precorrin-3B synthase